MALKLARWFLVAVFLFELYRAATQSFTVDEAFLYLNWIKPGFRAILGTYDAAHHVLYTWLEWLISKPLGYGELVLRLPSLGACAAYLVFVYRFANRLTAGPWYRLGAVVLLATNPLILDHLAIARGYGLALALFAWSIDSILNNRMIAAGVLVGLSIAANLTFLFPVGALIVAVVALKPSRSLINEFIGPGVVVAFVLMIVPITHASQANYYFGTPTVADSVKQLIRPTYVRTFEDFGETTGYALLATCALLILAGAASRIAGSSAEAKSSTERKSGTGLPAREQTEKGLAASSVQRPDNTGWLLLITLSLAITFTLASHWLLKLPLPEGRTGLWLIFLLILTAIESASKLPLQTVVGALLLVLGLAQAVQNDPRYFKEWKFDSSTKRMLRKIRDREAPLGRPFTFEAKDYLHWSVDYYRFRFKIKTMTVNPEKPAKPPDYILIHSIDAPKHPEYVRVLGDRLCECEIDQIR